MPNSWIADRTRQFDSDGIRRMFELARKLKDPINLSIGQPDFAVPQLVKDEITRAIRENKNGYTPTEGIAPLREKLQRTIVDPLEHSDRKLFVCSGTSGGLTLAMMSLINPGDEVIFFDPYFVMYPAIVELVGGRPVIIDNYPDFRFDVGAVASAITPKTKMILLNSPANPTGVCPSPEEIREIALLAAERNICLVSDEIYSRFCYDAPHVSPARFNDQAIVVDGFSKPYAMTGLRAGYVHGPSEIIETMSKLQQLTFVCAPAPVQWGCIAALDVDIQGEVDRYRLKRDYLLAELANDYEIAIPGGAFYVFPKLPWGDGDSFQNAAIAENLLIIPGKIFSRHDTHFRISYAVDDQTLERGIEVLKNLARNPVAFQPAGT